MTNPVTEAVTSASTASATPGSMPDVIRSHPAELSRITAWISREFPEHPVVPLPAPGRILQLFRQPDGEEAVKSLWKQRQDYIQLMRDEPLAHGWEPECWKDARELLTRHDELLIQGGNRAGKTELAAKLVVEALVAKPESAAWCLHSVSQSSIEMQQPVIRRMIPAAWRTIGKKGSTTNISYTAKNGFSEQVFVLPNGSRCRFLNYTMALQVIEGGDLDIIWCDELVPHDWVETLRYRLITRRGKLLITFTPVNGFSLVVKDYIAGSTVSQWRPSPLLPARSNMIDNGRPGPVGHMPYIRDCAKPERAIIYFFTEWNPFSDYGKLAEKLKGLRDEHIKIRAYGYTERMETAMFPKFGDIHIVPPEKIPPGRTASEAPPGSAHTTNYVVCDPAGVKNWFIKWYRVQRIADDIEHVFVYREWPDMPTHGEWALPADRPEGRPGPAQKSHGGRGIRDYKRLILELEGWRYDDATGRWDGAKAELIADRIIDPRFGSAEVIGAEDGTSIMDMMIDEQRDTSGRVIGPSMIWRPASITRGGTSARLETSVQKINDALDYDDQQPLSILNAPRWYVSAECEQSVFAYREFTGCGEKENLKDIIDCDRYFVESECHHTPAGSLVSRGGGGY